jgi:hypothetical protein
MEPSLLVLIACGYYTNPVVRVSTPDPGVLRLSDGSFVAVTSSGFDDLGRGGRGGGGAFPLRTSSDLVAWREQGALFPAGSLPRWASAPFYAPEIHGPYHATAANATAATASAAANARGEAPPPPLTPPLYWAVYDALETATGLMAVGAAWSARATGPFTDLGAPLRRPMDLQPPGSPGGALSAIDATLWQNRSDGRLYLLWKNKLDANASAPQQRQIALQQLRAAALPSPSLSPVGGTARVLLLATEPWEQHDVEGPFLWEEPPPPPTTAAAAAAAAAAAGWLYMFYSGSNTYGASYAVGVARARSVGGPWAKMGAPLLHTRASFASGANTTFVSPGHNSVVRCGGSTYIVYHALRWNSSSKSSSGRGGGGGGSGTPRARLAPQGAGAAARYDPPPAVERIMLVDRLEWGNDGWPRVATADGAPSDTPQPLPRCAP